MWLMPHTRNWDCAMPPSYRNKSCCVVDNGLFVELAVTLSKSFGQVYYYSPWESAFPKSNEVLIGKGIPDVTRIDSIWPVLDAVDLWVFPDIYMGSLQHHLADDLGKRVWGSREGEELELDRMASKRHLARLGIPIGEHRAIKGLDKLREHLGTYDNQFVKISRTRGDMETFYSTHYKIIEPRLDELEHSLGAKKRGMQFIVEDAIDDAVEVGYDGYSVDGMFPNQCMIGIEIKDKGYVGVIRSTEDMPQAILSANAHLAGSLEAYQYRNFLSLEMRITRDLRGWVIDPCMRMGSPPGELAQVMYENLADIFWFGAQGILVEPVCKAKWGAELLIHSEWADKNWQAIDFPEEHREHYKFRNLTIMDGRYYVVPQSVGLPEIGAVLGLGDTMEEAITQCKEMADQVEGHFIEIYPDSLDGAQEEVAKLKEFGITL